MTSSNRKLNLAIISEFSFNGYSGGGEKRYQEISKRLAGMGHRVTWINMRHGCFVQGETLDGVKKIYLGTMVRNPPRRSLINFLTFSLELLWHLNTNKYDVIDAQTYSPLAAAFIALFLKRKRLVATIHDISDKDKNNFFDFTELAWRAEKLILSTPFKKVVTVSDAVKRALVNRMPVLPDDIKVIYNGVDLKEFDVVPEQDIVRDLIFVGRLVPHKGAQSFISICQKTRYTGAIIGSGPLADEVRNAVTNYENIEFIGRLESSIEVIRELKRSRLLVLPSTREGFGIVLAEAGAAGLPVVAYDTGGVKEVILDGITGRIVPEGQMDEMCRAIDSILSGTNATKMGQANRKLVEMKFTWEKASKALEELYLSISD